MNTVTILPLQGEVNNFLHTPNPTQAHAAMGQAWEAATFPPSWPMPSERRQA